MYKGKKYLAVIPARGGSKGIKNKNIIDVCGIPLIGYTIKSAKESKYIDYVYVSTDSEKIREVALKYGAFVPFLRDKALATDTAKTIDAILYTLEKFKENNEIYDYLVLLQPTSPLRTAEDIDRAIEELSKSDYNSLASISEVKDNPVLIRTINKDQSLNKLLNKNSTIRRQDFEKYYRINGAIYINEISEINADTSFNDNALGYIMPVERSIDIDNFEDLETVRNIIKNANNKT